jgi:hypothetical protein
MSDASMAGDAAHRVITVQQMEEVPAVLSSSVAVSMRLPLFGSGANEEHGAKAGS